MKKIMIAPNYDHLREFINQVHVNFDSQGTWIKDSRNKIKKFEVDEMELCVKSFVKMTVANRILYSFVRKTKAERSFIYGQHLLRLGVKTPAPISYVEIYNRFHIIKQAYYICLYEEYDFHMGNVFRNKMIDENEIIRKFMDSVVNKMHKQGIFHRDFNGANVLVKKNETSNYQFFLVDLNRISFRNAFNENKGLQHLKQISKDPKILMKLAECYANQKNLDTDMTIYKMLHFKYKGIISKKLIKKILHFLRDLF